MKATSLKKTSWKTLVILLFLLSGRCGLAQSQIFSNWPAGASPAEVGRLVTSRFLVTPDLGKESILYQEICVWYGALAFATVDHDNDLRAKLTSRFATIMDPSNAVRIPTKRHVDFSVFGALPLELYQETKDQKYLTLGQAFADRQWDQPDKDGLSAETRFWIDDMYMITLLQVQAYRATGDRKYVDRAAHEMAAYLDKLQRPNGLFYHAPDVPFFWGRGNGWMAAGMTELLRSLPQDNPDRARILTGYRKMMKALLDYQGKDGTWRQLVDHDEAWSESSSTGMFTFALVSGVRSGWLDEKTYGLAARRGWLALVGYIDQNADVTSVCEGTDKLNSLDHYLQRRRRTGDFHGQAPVLWAAAALLR